MESNTDERLSEEEIFGLLAAPRRREVLRTLDGADGAATIADLVTEITTVEHGPGGDATTRKAVYVSLHQTHVPRLVEAGVLAHDTETKTLSLTGPWRQLVAYLHFDPTARKPGLLSRMFGRPATPAAR